ncbi:MAG: dynamin family protein [Pyramidobacter sp.]|nr:dynamin family protein [Pyramidobacter sp.]
MACLGIRYNPYKISTEILVDGKKVNLATSGLGYVYGRRIQEWLEPRGTWRGFFLTLDNVLGEDIERIDYYGTTDDFDDFCKAYELSGKKLFSAKLFHCNSESVVKVDPYVKIRRIKDLFQELLNGPVPEFRTKEIEESFTNSLNSEFKIVVIAPTSSGKSTLINAVLGCDLLPATNQATTAAITEIKNNKNQKSFTVSAFKKGGAKTADREPATKERLRILNDDSEIEQICIEGPVSRFFSDQLHIVFVDTPGGNNALDAEHEMLMDRALSRGDQSLILFVFNCENGLGTNDSDMLLRKIAFAREYSQQARERFLFVANKADTIDPEGEPYQAVIETIKESLRKYKIDTPRLFLTSSQLAKLVRCELNGNSFNGQSVLSDREMRQLKSLCRRFCKKNHYLNDFADIPVKTREEMARDFGNYLQQAEKAKDYKSVLLAVELNSGIPALESAIQEYLDKYAVAMKIKDMCDSFMKTVREKQMIDNFKARIASDEREAERLKRICEERRLQHEHDKKLQEFCEKITHLTFTMPNLIKARTNVQKAIRELHTHNYGSIKRTEFEQQKKSFDYKVMKIKEKTISEVVEAIQRDVLASCQRIFDDYREWLDEREKQEAFNIGDFDLRQLKRYDKYTFQDADALLEMPYIEEKTEVVGKKWEKKAGFWAWIKGKFGGNSEYIDVDKYGTVEYVKFDAYLSAYVNLVQKNFENTIDTIKSKALYRVEAIKEKTVEKLKDLNNAIDEDYRNIQEMLDNREALKEKIAEDKEKREWVNSFVKRVNDILEI